MGQIVNGDNYTLYHDDCCEVLEKLPAKSIDLSIYSPPFRGLYHYSSSERDLSNCRDAGEFFEHYEFVVNHIERVTKPGRFTAVHCAEIQNGGGTLHDFPGDLVRMHEKMGFQFVARHSVWKEPLGVRMRTMAKGLAHVQVCDNSLLCDVASADYLLLFRKRGEAKEPVRHPTGLDYYAGSTPMPESLLKFKNWSGDQTKNKFSQWCWRRYASAFWDDIRIDRVVPFEAGRSPDDERHVHPLQLDVIERVLALRSNPGEVVLTPFMGVGSEVYASLLNGRRAIGVELKDTYFAQAVKNCASAAFGRPHEQPDLFSGIKADEAWAAE
jgi:DNA modification methylase